MANNNNRNNNGYNQNQGYQQNNGQNNGQRNNGKNRRMKRAPDGSMVPAYSGCGMKQSYELKDGTKVHRPLFFGWNKSSDGFATFSAFPCAKDFEVKSKSGNVWWKYLVKIKTGYNEILTTGFVNPTNMKLHMPDVRGGMLADPKAASGGYWTKNPAVKK